MVPKLAATCMVITSYACCNIYIYIRIYIYIHHIPVQILPLAFISSQLGSCVGLTPCLLPWVKQIEFGQDRADRASQHTTHSCPIKPYSDVYRTPASGGSLPMA